MLKRCIKQRRLRSLPCRGGEAVHVLGCILERNRGRHLVDIKSASQNSTCLGSEYRMTLLSQRLNLDCGATSKSGPAHDRMTLNLSVEVLQV